MTTWENEALTHVPLILEGGRPREKAHLSLAAVRRQMDETHARLVDLVRQWRRKVAVLAQLC